MTRRKLGDANGSANRYTAKDAAKMYQELLVQIEQWRRANKLVNGDEGDKVHLLHINAKLVEREQAPIDASIYSRIKNGHYPPTARGSAVWRVMAVMKEMCPYPIVEVTPLPVPAGPERIYVEAYNAYQAKTQAYRRLYPPAELLRRCGVLVSQASAGGEEFVTRQCGTMAATIAEAIAASEAADLTRREIADVLTWTRWNLHAGLERQRQCHERLVPLRLCSYSGTALFHCGLLLRDNSALEEGWALIQPPATHPHEQKDGFCEEVVNCLTAAFQADHPEARGMSAIGLRLAIERPWPWWSVALRSRDPIVLEHWQALDPVGVARLLTPVSPNQGAQNVNNKTGFAALIALCVSIVFASPDTGHKVSPKTTEPVLLVAEGVTVRPSPLWIGTKSDS